MRVRTQLRQGQHITERSANSINIDAARNGSLLRNASLFSSLFFIPGVSFNHQQHHSEAFDGSNCFDIEGV
jgi:hypothetical protein